MDKQERLLEFKVGIFVLIGLMVIGAMIIEFGLTREGFKKYYQLTLHLPDANGLLKGSEVQLAGARIGYVSEKPTILPTVGAVSISVKVLGEIKLPRTSKFEVGSSGLLGDRFVQVSLPKGFDSKQFNPDDPKQIYSDGEVIEGTSAGGLNELMEKGATVMDKAPAVMDELKAALVKLKDTTTNLNQRLEVVLSDANLKNLEATLSNLKVTSTNFAETSKNLDGVVKNASGVMDSTKKTMESANAAAVDIRGAIADSRKVIETARLLLRRFSEGNGPIPTLLSDKTLSDNLKALVANLRQKGILFYKDVTPRTIELNPKPSR